MTTQRKVAAIDASAYGVRIRHAEFDGEWLYEASVREFPDLTEYAETFEAAYALMMDAIATASEMLAEQGREVPPPYVPEQEFSGRVSLRVPRKSGNPGWTTMRWLPRLPRRKPNPSRSSNCTSSEQRTELLWRSARIASSKACTVT